GGAAAALAGVLRARQAGGGQHGPEPAAGVALEALERVAGLAAARCAAQEVPEAREQEDVAPGARLALGGGGEHGVAPTAGTEHLAGAPQLAPVEGRVAEAHSDAVCAWQGAVEVAHGEVEARGAVVVAGRGEHAAAGRELNG